MIHYGRKPTWSEINMYERHSVHHKSHMVTLEADQNLQRKKQAINLLGYGMVYKQSHAPSVTYIEAYINAQDVVGLLCQT
jgi:hypothetical protein